MKLGIIGDEVSQEIDEVIEFCREFELDGIEIRSVFGRAFKDLTKEDVAVIGKKMKDAGLTLAGCASPVFKCPVDDLSQIKEHTEIFKRSLEVAHAWDCSIVRIFTFLRREPQSSRDDLAKAAEFCRPLVELAREAGVQVGIENEFSTIVATGPETASFLDFLSHPEGVGVVWDPCNVLYLPGENDPVHDDYPKVEKDVIHVHIKDAKRNGTEAAETCIEVGTGQLDFPAQFKMLKANNFQGWVTLETHWRVKSLSSEETHLPAGYAFSEGGREASKICMTNLKRIIQEA